MNRRTFGALAPWLFGLAMVCSAISAALLVPAESRIIAGQIDLERMVPEQFADWTAVPSPLIQADVAVRRDERDPNSLAYDQVLMRTYQNSHGEQVQLALAWGRQQRQEGKIHRPELCYVAQGFSVEPKGQVPIDDHRHILANSLLTAAPGRIEPVVYWIRVGDRISTDAWRTRGYILRQGLAGRIPDGILVRTSQVVEGREGFSDSIGLQRDFLRQLIAAMPKRSPSILAPESHPEGNHLALKVNLGIARSN